MGSGSTVAPGWKKATFRHSVTASGVEQYDTLDAVERAAAGTLDRAARPLLFDRLAWYRLVERHAAPDGCLLAIRGGTAQDCAWLFLAVSGRSAHAFANWYSLRFSAIGDSEPAIVALAAGLRRRMPRLDRITLAPLDADDPLPGALRAAGWLIVRKPASVSWQIDTKDMDFDTYWRSRPSRLRNTAKRKAKAAGLQTEIHRDFAADAWADYEEVYAASWKPAEGSTAFLRALAKQEGAAGTLRLGIARKDGRPVAAQLWLVENGVATIHKLAYVQELRELSPGTVLSVAMFRHALDVDKVDRIDFGTGDDAYKAEWMDKSMPLYRVVAFHPTSLAGLLGYGRALAAKLVQRV